MKGTRENDSNLDEQQGLLEQWSETMYPDLNWQPDANRLFDKSGSILVKRRFEGVESIDPWKVRG